MVAVNTLVEYVTVLFPVNKAAGDSLNISGDWRFYEVEGVDSFLTISPLKVEKLVA